MNLKALKKKEEKKNSRLSSGSKHDQPGKKKKLKKGKIF